MITPRRLANACIVLVVTYFALWACAPTLSGPALTPLPAGQNKELTIGGQGGILFDGPEPFKLGSGRIGYRRISPKSGTQIGGLLYGGFPDYLGAAFSLQQPFVRKPSFQMGVSGEVGWLYAAVGLPVAVALREDRIWLYAHPQGRLGGFGVAKLPVGLQLYLGHHLSLAFEGGAAYGVFPFGSILTPATGYPVAGYAGFQLGYRFE